MLSTGWRCRARTNLCFQRKVNYLSAWIWRFKSRSPARSLIGFQAESNKRALEICITFNCLPVINFLRKFLLPLFNGLAFRVLHACFAWRFSKQLVHTLSTALLELFIFIRAPDRRPRSPAGKSVVAISLGSRRWTTPDNLHRAFRKSSSTLPVPDNLADCQPFSINPLG